MIDWQADWQRLNSLDPQKKVIATGGLFIIFIVGLIGGIFWLRRLPPKTSAPAAPVSDTTLALSPAKKVLSQGEEVVVNVELMGQAVPVADVTLSYDPAVFAVSDLVAGEVFSQVINSQVEEGKISFSASVDPAAAKPEPLRTGTVFSFKLRSLAKTASQGSRIDFDLEKTLTAKEGQNTLASTNGARFIVR